MESIVEKKILFDRHTAPYTWCPDADYNEMFLQSTSHYFHDLLKVKTYISWETICDYLGVSITPDEIENTAVYRLSDKHLVMTAKLKNKREKAYEITFKEVDS